MPPLRQSRGREQQANERAQAAATGAAAAAAAAAVADEDEDEEDEEDGEQVETTTPADFESFLREQPKEIRELYDRHIHGLRTALQSEREGKSKLEKQLGQLRKQIEAGSDLEKQLGELQDQVRSERIRVQFYEEASGEGVTNLRLAYIAARESELIDESGRVDWRQLKADFPQLFRAAEPQPRKTDAKARAGTGDGGGVRRTMSMNEVIRSMAGFGDT